MLFENVLKLYIRKYQKSLLDIYNNSEISQKQLCFEIFSLSIRDSTHNKVYKFSENGLIEHKNSLKINDYSNQKVITNNLRIFNKGRNQNSIAYFAQSAGTTSGSKKLIPISKEYINKNLRYCSWLCLAILYQNNPKIKIFSRKNLLVGGAIYSELKSKTKVADISGIMLDSIPWFMEPYYLPGKKIGIQEKWDKKLEQTAQIASTERNVSLIGGLPTWTLALLKRILEKTQQDNFLELWPHASAYLYGGVDFEPYRDQFKSLFPHTNFSFIEIYNASEGFFAINDDPLLDDMLLVTNAGVYYEFLSFEKYQQGERYSAIEISEVELHIPYCIVISTISGLERYLLGDVIKFTNIRPYRIKIIGRTTEYLNAFGEDTSLCHIKKAIENITKLYQCKILQFTLAPKYITANEKGYYELYALFDNPPDELLNFAYDLDLALQHNNPNYLQKRSDDIALTCMRVFSLSELQLENWYRKNNKLGGQNKLPQIRNDRKIVNELRAILEEINL